MIVTDTAKFVQMDVADITKFVKIDVADAVQFVTSARRVKQRSRTRTRGNSETCESRGGEFVEGSRRRTWKQRGTTSDVTSMRQSNNCPVQGPVESECEGEEVKCPGQQKKKGVVRTKPTKTVKLATSCLGRRHAGVRSGRQEV